MRAYEGLVTVARDGDEFVASVQRLLAQPDPSTVERSGAPAVAERLLGPPR